MGRWDEAWTVNSPDYNTGVDREQHDLGQNMVSGSKKNFQ